MSDKKYAKGYKNAETGEIFYYKDEEGRQLVTEQYNTIEKQNYNMPVNAFLKGIVFNDIAKATLNTTILNDALFDSDVKIGNGIVYIDDTIIIPKNRKLICDNTTIIQTVNKDVFKINDKSYLSKPYIKFANELMFDKSVVNFDDNESMSGASIDIKALNNIEKPKGIGINCNTMNIENKAIFFNDFNFFIEGFEKCINIESKLNTTNFCTANKFKGFSIHCPYAIFVENGDGNTFDIQGQVGVSKDIPSIYLNGQLNILNATIFDVGVFDNVSDIGLIIVNGRNNHIISNLESNAIIDNSGMNNITDNSHMVYAPSNSQGVYPFNNTPFIGEQSNFLTGADRRFNVTETLTNAENWSQLKYAFEPTGAVGLAYHNTDIEGVAQISIEFDEKKFIPLFGISLRNNLLPTKMILRAYDINNVEKTMTFNPSLGGKYVFNLKQIEYPYHVNIKKIEYEIYFDHDICIDNVFASCSEGGNTFIPTTGGTMLDDINFNKGFGTVLESPNGTKYRLIVNNDGTIGSQRI